MRVRILKFAGAAVLSGSLVACGGGGGGGGDVAPTPMTPANLSFALDAGYETRIKAGTVENFTLSGSCGGTATITTAAAVPSSPPFEGVIGYSASQVSTVSFTPGGGCTTASPTTSGATYYNANYVPIGLTIVGGEYSKFETPPTDLPTSVKVGDTAVFATMITYRDSTRTETTGKRVLSYEIRDGTATQARAVVITRSYNLSDQLLATQESVYLIAQSGALTLEKIDVQFSTTSTLHLVYTRQ